MLFNELLYQYFFGVAMTIEPLMKQIICMKNMDRFSVTEIRAAFIALSKDEELDKRKLRQFIYDDLNKLVKKGLLSKSTSENGKESRFKKSSNFDPSLLVVQSDNNGILDVINKIRMQLSELDLSPKFNTMTLMRFPIKLTYWRSQNEETIQRRTNHPSHQTA